MNGIRIGSIFGVEIRIDYSWFVIFFLILFTLTRGVFPAAHPDLSPAAHIAMGAAGTLLFFASLLAHELSHSLVARRRGIPVHGITLFIFGGMARAAGEFRTPRDELVIAGVGPLSSLLIALLFQGVVQAGRLAGLSEAITGVAAYLAAINLLLAVFNLVPGFPLDGGRLLRAVVWQRTGDMRRATRVASNGGKAFGYLLMLLGFLNLFGGAAIGGLWLIFIGWFLRTAAESSYTQFVLRHSLRDVRAQDVMTPDPAVVAPDLTLQAFIERHVLDGRHHSYPVVDDGAPIGIVTLERVRTVPRDDWGERTVADVMVPAGDALVADPGDDMDRVLDRLATSPARRVLVVHGGTLIGIISHTDVTRWLERQRLREQLGR